MCQTRRRHIPVGDTCKDVEQTEDGRLIEEDSEPEKMSRGAGARARQNVVDIGS